MEGNQERFKRNIFLQENMKLFKAMKHTQPIFFAKMIRLFERGEDPTGIEVYKENGNTCFKYVPNKTFEGIFGPVILTFEGDNVKSGAIIDIVPREYLYDSFRSGHHEYKGVVIPNMEKYKFMVDVALAKKSNREDFINKMSSILK